MQAESSNARLHCRIRDPVYQWVRETNARERVPVSSLDETGKEWVKKYAPAARQFHFARPVNPRAMVSTL